jgi:hypothetical protein
MGWKHKSLILLAVIWLAACEQPAPSLNHEDTPDAPGGDGSSQGDFFTVENAQLTEGRYIVPPGEVVTLRWRITTDEEVYIKQTVPYGPLPSEGTLEVCPQPLLTPYYLYTGGNPDHNSDLSYELYLVTHMEIDIDQPIDLESACWGHNGDYFIATSSRALMNDMVLLLWSVRDVEWVTIMTSYGTEPVDHYGALPPSGALAVCEQNEAAYTLNASNKPSMQVTVSRANTAFYASRQVYGECPFTGPVSWP